MRYSRRIYPGADKLITVLLSAGLIMGLITMLIDSQALASLSMVAYADIYDQMVRARGYRELKILEILAVVSAGIIAYVTEGRYCVPRWARILFAVMLLWMTGHAFLAFYDGFSNSELINQKGPAVWWAMLVIFCGCSKRRWKTIYPIIVFIVIVGSLEMAFRISTLSGTFARVQAGRTLQISLQIMLWSAPVVFLIPGKTLLGSFFSLIPLGLITVSAVITGTRSWVVICAIYFFLIIKLKLKNIKSIGEKQLILLGLSFGVCISFYLLLVVFPTQLENGVDILLGRLDADSRTWQLEQFFANVPLSDLLTGTGPRGLWWMGNREYGYVDGTYFFMLFLGGAPLLITYLFIIVYPAIKCFFKYKLSLYGSLDFTCIFLVLIWALVLSGLGTFTSPEAKMSHYLIALCAGRCWAILNDRDSERAAII